jgi:hypothetical protein
MQNGSPKSSVNVRSSYLAASNTPQQEWDNCSSADACGPGSGDTKLESSTSTINGLDAYNLKMQSSTGIYYATVIKGTKVTSDGIPFDEFIFNSTDTSSLNIYKQIVASATFPN